MRKRRDVIAHIPPQKRKELNMSHVFVLDIAQKLYTPSTSAQTRWAIQLRGLLYPTKKEGLA